MDRIERLHGPRAVPLRLPAMSWLTLAMPTLVRAQSANPLERLHLPDPATLLVLGAGFGVVVIAGGVLVFAIRQLRREAEERRRLYNRHRRGGRVHRSHLEPPTAPTTD